MGGVTIREVLSEALHLDLKDQSKAAVMRAASIVAGTGWRKRRVMIGAVQSWRWERA